MISRFVADMIVKPGISPVVGDPGEMGLDFTEVRFPARDGVELSGWHLRGAGNGIVLMSHFGVAASRTGYTPEGRGLVKPYGGRVRFLEVAANLVGAGYDVLMYDLRNHGASAAGACGWVTGGVEERLDVLGAVELAADLSGEGPIGLLSYCMGANATTYAFAEEGGLRDVDRLRAFIAVQPLSNAAFLRAFGIPQGLVASANRVNMRRGGVDLEENCVASAEAVSVPTLVVQARNDPWTDFELVEGFYANLGAEKEMLWIEGTRHRFETYSWFGHTPEPMLEFFGRQMK